MSKKCFVLVVFQCILSRSIGETANVPQTTFSRNYHVHPAQNFHTLNHMGMYPMMDHPGIHVPRPSRFNNPKNQYGHNININPAYLSVLNNPKIKTKYGFMFSSPHQVQFHNKNGEKVKFNAHIHIESLEGNFVDFIKADGHLHHDENYYKPQSQEESSGQFHKVKPTGNAIQGDVTEATPAVQATTLKSSSVTEINEGQEDVLYDIDIRHDTA